MIASIASPFHILVALTAGLVSAPVTHRLGPCIGDRLCGFDRAEDVSLIPRTDWVLVSQHGVQPLLLVNLENGTRHSVTLNSDRNRATLGSETCSTPPTALATRGNAVARIRRRLTGVVINSADKNNRIEFFNILSRETPTASWIGCVDVPEPYVLNDIALAADGSIYATHMYERPDGEAGFAKLRARFMAAEHTGFVVRWRKQDGWTKIEGTDMSLPNGIALSRDDRELAIGGTFEQAVTLISVRTGKARRIALPLQPDNVTPIAGGGFLVAGHTGAPVTGVDGCRPADAIPCGFSFAVARVDSRKAPEVLLKHDGSVIPGASVAVSWNGGLILGSAYGDRLTFVPRANLSNVGSSKD